MKLRLLALSLLLAACAKDKGTTATTSAQATPTPACPMFDGRYVGQDNDGTALEFELHSKASGSSVSYSLGEAGSGFIPADGVGRHYETTQGNGTLIYTCNANSFTMETRDDRDGSSKLIFNQESFTSIRLEAFYKGEHRATMLTKQP